MLVDDGDGTVLLASWGDDAKACRFAAKRLHELATRMEQASGVDAVESVTAELPTDDGEAGGDD